MKRTRLKRQMITKLLIVGLFSMGVFVALYPFYVNAINYFLDQQRVTQYKQDETEQMKEQMLKTNEVYAESGTSPGVDPFSDTAEAPIVVSEEAHWIGTIDIPKINVSIPLFDTTTENLLDRGATVLQGTSYPTGGENTHAVISAHRGLPNRKLFTDLDQLSNKDIFIIDILGEKHAYEVDQIDVVEPSDTSLLNIVPGEDLITLLTCTPYMVNSHRLLVRGHRIPYTEAMTDAMENSHRQETTKQAGILSVMVLLCFLVGGLVYKVLHSYLLAKRTFTVVFYRVTADGLPVSNANYQLFTASGKRPVLRDGQPVTAAADETGKIMLVDLPGGTYQVKELQPAAENTIQISVKKLKQATMIIERISPIEAQPFFTDTPVTY